MTIRATFSVRQAISTGLLVVGVACLGVWSSSILYSQYHQIYDAWSFERAREAASAAAPESAPLPVFIVGGKHHRASARPAEHKPAPDSVIGRVEVPRLHLSAMVEEGTDTRTLSRAVGHVIGTAFPGAQGNVAIAGHRDSFFRALKDLQRNDEIDFETTEGSFRYTVEEMTVVEPDDVAVLAPTRDRMLTIVTCFPFNYIGPAPRRFIVRAKQVSELSRWSPAIHKSVPARVESSLPE